MAPDWASTEQVNDSHGLFVVISSTARSKGFSSTNWHSAISHRKMLWWRFEGQVGVLPSYFIRGNSFLSNQEIDDPLQFYKESSCRMSGIKKFFFFVLESTGCPSKLFWTNPPQLGQFFYCQQAFLEIAESCLKQWRSPPHRLQPSSLYRRSEHGKIGFAKVSWFGPWRPCHMRSRKTLTLPLTLSVCAGKSW